jgi:hypothetical protein
MTIIGQINAKPINAGKNIILIIGDVTGLTTQIISAVIESNNECAITAAGES